MTSAIAPTAPPSGLDISNLLGAVFAASFLSVAVWGISTMQTFIYYARFPKDNVWLILVVATLWVLDTAHEAIFIMGRMYRFPNHLDASDLFTHIPVELFMSLLPSVVATAVCQAFFIHRLWKLSRKNIIFPVLITPLILIQFVTSIYYISIIIRKPTSAQLQTCSLVALVSHSLAAATDIALSVCMVYLLFQERRRYVISNRTIPMLAMITVNGGVWTAILALAILIALLIRPPPNFIFGAIYLILSPLYCNTVLGTLNSRELLRQDGTRQSADIPLNRMFRLRNPPGDKTQAIELGSALRMEPGQSYK